MRFTNYLKTAFLNQWNLLAFLGAAAFGVVSGAPDIVLPLVAAGEVAFDGVGFSYASAAGLSRFLSRCYRKRDGLQAHL